MSETPQSARGSVPTGQFRPLAVRLSDDVRAQLDLIAQLRDRSVTEEIRVALEFWIDRAKSDPQLQAVADEARRQIEADAERRRTAIMAIFDTGRETGAQRRGSAKAATADRTSPEQKG